MSSQVRLSTRFVLSLASVVWIALPAPAADSPTPTATQTPRPAGGTSLKEVAKETELKGAEKGKSIVISNENLSEYADKGSVTSVDDGDSRKRRPVRDTTNVNLIPPSDAGSNDERRRYWQGQYRSQVNLVAAIRNQINVIDEEVPGLWRDFYAWDDPMYRDGVIKPKLDAAIARRQKLEQQLADGENRLNEIKDLARRDGAEPGWFRAIPMPTPFPPTPTPGVIVY